MLQSMLQIRLQFMLQLEPLYKKISTQVYFLAGSIFGILYYLGSIVCSCLEINTLSKNKKGFNSCSKHKKSTYRKDIFPINIIVRIKSSSVMNYILMFLFIIVGFLRFWL